MAMPKNPGEEKAWELLENRKPEEVCRAAEVSWNESLQSYRVISFGIEFHVSLANKTIMSSSPGSELLLGKLAYFFKLSLLWYLVAAKELACTGRLVKLEAMKGGEIFTKGSHVLPLEPLARKFGKDKEAFLQKGTELGGLSEKLGDAALQLFPLPRIPVVLTLWLEDEEFPARADLLFDSTCGLQVSTDIIWSIAMMTVLVML